MKINNKIKQNMNKKAFELEMLGWWIIGAAVLVIGVLSYFILTGKIDGAVKFIKDIFRFG
jgi:hypothetical protein